MTKDLPEANVQLFFTRNYEDNTVTASEWPDVIDIDSFFIGWGDGDVMSTVVTFRCANGSAAYRIIGIRDGGAFVAERLQ